MNPSRGTLLALLAAFAVVSALLVAPFLQYLLIAILLGYILYPLQERLEPRLGPSIAAVLLVVLAIIVLLLPFVVMFGAVLGDALNLLQAVEEGEIDSAFVEDEIEAYTGIEISLADLAAGVADDAAGLLVGTAPGIVGQLTHALIGLGLAVFLLYYLLKEGDSLVAWLRTVAPLPEDVQDDLLDEIDDVTWAVLIGHVFIAIFQGTIAGLGLWVTDIPNAAFWTFVMILFALLPLIGAFMVWGPASAYLFLTGEPVAAAGLFVYGAIVVSVSDEYLRPVVVNRRTSLNPGVIVLGVVGGLYVLGFMGIFFGPVILGGLKATLTTFEKHYDRLGRW